VAERSRYGSGCCSDLLGVSRLGLAETLGDLFGGLANQQPMEGRITRTPNVARDLLLDETTVKALCPISNRNRSLVPPAKST
jgi:hypothetical protein